MVKKGKFSLELVHTPLSDRRKNKLRTLIKTIRQHRRAAGSVFKQSPKAGEAIKLLRNAYRQAVNDDSRFFVQTTRTDADSIPRVPFAFKPAATQKTPWLAGMGEKTVILSDFRAYLQQLRRNRKTPTYNAFRNTNRLLSNETGFYYKRFQIEWARKGKGPDRSSKADYVGIELECYVKSREAVTKALFPFHKNLSIVGDGSISPPSGFEDVEVRVIAKKSELREILFPVLDVIKANEGGTNKSCGTHVHFDMGRKEKDDVSRCYVNLFMVQDILLAMMPAERRASSYCKKCVYIEYEQQARHSRYSLINSAAYNKHRTLEVRLHDGTLDGEELVKWIGLIHSIMANPVPPKEPIEDAEAFKLQYGLSAKEYEYVTARLEMFKHVPKFSSDGFPILSPDITARLGEEPVWLDGYLRWQTAAGRISPVSRDEWMENAERLIGTAPANGVSNLRVTGRDMTAACAAGGPFGGCRSCADVVTNAVSLSDRYYRRELSELRPAHYSRPVGAWVDHIGVACRYNPTQYAASFERRVLPSPVAGSVSGMFPGERDAYSQRCALGIAACESCRIEATGAMVMTSGGSHSLLEPVEIRPSSGSYDHRGRPTYYSCSTWRMCKVEILTPVLRSVGLEGIPTPDGLTVTEILSAAPPAEPVRPPDNLCNTLNCEYCCLEAAGVDVMDGPNWSMLPPTYRGDSYWRDHKGRKTIHNMSYWRRGDGSLTSAGAEKMRALWAEANKRYCPAGCVMEGCFTCWQVYAISGNAYRQEIDELRAPTSDEIAEVDTCHICGANEGGCSCCSTCEHEDCCCCGDCNQYPCGCEPAEETAAEAQSF